MELDGSLDPDLVAAMDFEAPPPPRVEHFLPESVRTRLAQYDFREELPTDLFDGTDTAEFESDAILRRSIADVGLDADQTVRKAELRYQPEIAEWRNKWEPVPRDPSVQLPRSRLLAWEPAMSWDTRALDESDWWPSECTKEFLQEIERGDLDSALTYFSHDGGDLLLRFLQQGNEQSAKALGIFEELLLGGFTWLDMGPVACGFTAEEIADLFRAADSDLLFYAGGADLPDEECEIFRGLDAAWPDLRLEGPSWTTSLECAQWFACVRGVCSERQSTPVVARALVSDTDVLCANDHRNESEIIAYVPKDRISVEPLAPSQISVTRAWIESGTGPTFAELGPPKSE